jgi:hypothetical protein
MNTATLSIYLNDHLGIMAGEVELAQRTAGENKETQLAMTLHRYVGEVSEQKRAIEHVINGLGEEPSRAKQAAGWLLEKVGRLKPNNSLGKYSDLSRLLELEMLINVATSRLHLWQTLKPHDTNSLFKTVSGDFARFETETKRQLEALQEFHAEAGRGAFGKPYATPADVPEQEKPATTEGV